MWSVSIDYIYNKISEFINGVVSIDTDEMDALLINGSS